jgi:hypothetical protein
MPRDTHRSEVVSEMFPLSLVLAAFFPVQLYSFHGNSRASLDGLDNLGKG